MEFSILSRPIKILVIGNGIAAMHAVRILAKNLRKSSMEISLAAPGKSLFLPLLPDLLADNIHSPESISFEYQKELEKFGFKHIQQKVVKIQIEEKTVTLDDKSNLKYDYILIAVGSVPAFILPKTLSLKNEADALNIRENVLKLIKKKKNITVIVVGGGYTGVETVTAIRRLCLKNKYKNGTFILAEMGPDILLNLNAKIRNKVKNQLVKAGIEIRANSAVKVDKKGVFINDKKIAADLVIVSAGVKGAAQTLLPDFIDQRSGRLIVDKNLKVSADVFAVGDASYFKEDNEMPLRQSINFSIYQGKIAAKNIIREISDRRLLRFKPMDLGYLVPNFTTKKAYGIALGISIGGRFGMMLHYLMCIYRSLSFRKRIQVFRALIFRK